MDVVVQKFGGTSVANAERIIAAARRAIRAHKAGHQVVVVVSARGDTTDNLIAMANEITENPPEREMDMLLSTGEQISIALMAMAIQSLGVPAISFTGAQIGIQTDSSHTRARIKRINVERLHQALQDNKIVIVAGFQGIDEHANITTLGRGGSDTTAVAVAAAIKHAQGPLLIPVRCEIYTDVDGIYTTDPRLVPEARKIDEISYDEMLELASVGAGVMHSRSIEFASKFGVPLSVRSSMTDNPGTEIIPEADWMSNVIVCGAALVRDEARITLYDLPDTPGVSHRIFSTMAEKHIVVDMIAQNAGEDGKANVGFTVLANDLSTTLALLQPLANELNAKVEHEEAVSKVSVVGTGMRTHTAVAERMFAALSEADINMKMITTGDIKISVLVDKQHGVKALEAVHQAFGLGEPHLGSGISPKEQTDSDSTFPRKPTTSSAMPTVQDFAQLTQQLTNMEEIVVSDVQLTTYEGRITIFNLPDQPGHCSNIFQAIAQAGIVVDMIVQNLTPAGAELSFSVPEADLDRALELTRKVTANIAPHVRVDKDSDIAKLVVSGVGMRTHTGVARRMFGALAKHDININLINTSEVRISVVVDGGHGEPALKQLRHAFHL